MEKTFWEIEEEKTWRIYLIFGFLILLHFVAVFMVWFFIKCIVFVRQYIIDPQTTFRLFGYDTLIVLIIATVIAFIHWYYSNRRVVDKILAILGARHPDRYDKYHHIFQNVVDEIEAAAGGLKVERYILPTGAMNAFALADLQGRKVIGVTEGLLSRLDRNELQSVIAHEMAHIISNDCLETTITCSLFGLYSEAIRQYNKTLRRSEPHPLSFRYAGRDWTPHSDAFALSVLSLPLLLVLFILDLLSQFLKMFVSREREYRADASAVKYTRNPLALARALYKISTHWRGAGQAGGQLSPIFILGPELNPLSEKDNLLADMFSTHPPMRKRLQVILNMAHSDLNQLVEYIKKEEHLRTEPTTKTLEPRFLVERDGKLLGPYTILQLQTLDWLAPETRISIEGHSEIMRCQEIPALNHFFLVRTEPLWKIRRLCPTCREWLIVQEYEGAYLWRCPFCNGLLIEQEKLPRIFVREEKGFTETVQRTAQILQTTSHKKQPRFRLVLDTPHPRPCPKCGKLMVRKFFSYAYHVEIDECVMCRLVWFDADELEILQYLIQLSDDKG